MATSICDRARFSPRAGLSYRLTDKPIVAGQFRHLLPATLLYLSSPPFQRIAGCCPFRADHYVTGFSYVASDSLRFTVEAYRKNYRDYPVSTQFPSLSLASVGDTFATRDILFPLTSAGRGRAQGIEFFAEKKFTTRWFGQTNLALSRTRVAGLDGIMQAGNLRLSHSSSTSSAATA
jgi:hypothetical protein